DAFVTKFDARGATAVYSTYLGGSGTDVATGLAVDSLGNAYVTGPTTSADLPALNPLATAGAKNTFLSSLSPNGAMLMSSYTGSDSPNEVKRAGVDAEAGLYIAGNSADGEVSLSRLAGILPQREADHAKAVSIRLGTLGGAVRTDSGFRFNKLPSAENGGAPGCLDFCSFQTSLGFVLSFFGNTYNSVWVNNHGNITFGTSTTQYTPSSLSSVTTPIIAPLWADADTRTYPVSAITSYGTGTVSVPGVGIRNAFGATWDGVGYFSLHTDKLNSFQVILIDRSDRSAGAFDIEFNYNQVLWETGDDSGGTNGLGGTSARAGYSKGTGAVGTYFELAGSGINGRLLDSGQNSLRYNSVASSGVLGRYVYPITNAQSCSFSLNPTGATSPAAAGGSSVAVTATPVSCAWTAVANVAWIHITGGASGTGNGTVNYTVDANPSANPRNGTMTIAGQTFTVSQSGASCTFTFNPSETSLTAAAAGIGPINITVTPNLQSCTWAATSGAAWISIVGGANGTGTGTVSYAVAANATPQQRAGTFNIAGTVFTVTQAAAACTYTLNPQITANPPAIGATYTIGITTQQGCNWAASTGAQWVHFTSNSNSGAASANLIYSVDANQTGATRTWVLTVTGNPTILTFNQSQATNV
ncbi:MAG: nidogen-like domain-containing protein, partial [Bryobacteraceae bacterium]